MVDFSVGFYWFFFEGRGSFLVVCVLSIFFGGGFCVGEGFASKRRKQRHGIEDVGNSPSRLGVGCTFWCILPTETIKG